MHNDSLQVQEMAARLDRVERRHRWLLCSIIAAVIVLASTGLVKAQFERQRGGVTSPAEIGFPPQLIQNTLQEVIEERVVAREFMLVDRDGNHRASLVADNAGSVFLTLLDAESNLRASLSVMNRGPALTFYDPDGQVRTVIGSTNLVASHVEDAAGNIERGTPSSIVLFDSEGGLLWREP